MNKAKPTLQILAFLLVFAILAYLSSPEIPEDITLCTGEGHCFVFKDGKVVDEYLFK